MDGHEYIKGVGLIGPNESIKIFLIPTSTPKVLVSGMV